MTTKRRIFAMGGGGFLMEPENPRLDDYVLSLAGQTAKRVCFIPTASGDSRERIESFLQAFTPDKCEPSVLSLYRGPHADVRAHLLAQDLIYVGGGNTRNMLTLWKLWGVDSAIREAYERGVVLAGVSAGSICWFEQGITDSWPGELRPMPCLGFLKGSNCPHYDGEEKRRPTYQRVVADGSVKDGVAADDGAGLLYENEALIEVVSSRASASAWRVEKTADGMRETRIAARLL